MSCAPRPERRQWLSAREAQSARFHGRDWERGDERVLCRAHGTAHGRLPSAEVRAPALPACVAECRAASRQPLRAHSPAAAKPKGQLGGRVALGDPLPTVLHEQHSHAVEGPDPTRAAASTTEAGCPATTMAGPPTLSKALAKASGGSQMGRSQLVAPARRGADSEHLRPEAIAHGRQSGERSADTTGDRDSRAHVKSFVYV